MCQLHLLFLLSEFGPHECDECFLARHLDLLRFFRLFVIRLLCLLLQLLLLILLLVFELLLVKDDWFTAVVERHQRRVQDVCAQHLKVLTLVLCEYDVFRFEVGVDDPTDAMEIVESHKRLLGYLSDDRHWNTAIVVALDHCQQVLSKHLKCHNRVSPVWTDVEELVKHLQVVSVSSSQLHRGLTEVLANRHLPLRVLEVVRDFVKNFLFLKGTFGVLFRTLLDLEGVKLLVLELECEPYSAEVAPAEFAKQHVPRVEDLVHVTRVVAVNFVVVE